MAEWPLWAGPALGRAAGPLAPRVRAGQGRAGRCRRARAASPSSPVLPARPEGAAVNLARPALWEPRAREAAAERLRGQVQVRAAAGHWRGP